MTRVTVRGALSGDVVLEGDHCDLHSLLEALADVEDVDCIVLLCENREVSPADFATTKLELTAVRDPWLGVLPRFVRTHTGDERQVPRKALGDVRLLRRALSSLDLTQRQWLARTASFHAEREAWEDTAFVEFLLEEAEVQMVPLVWRRAPEATRLDRRLCLTALRRKPEVFLDFDRQVRDEPMAAAALAACRGNAKITKHHRVPLSLRADPLIADALVTRSPEAFARLPYELRTRSRALRALQTPFGGSASILQALTRVTIDKSVVLASIAAAHGRSYPDELFALIKAIPAEFHADEQVIAALAISVAADAYAEQLLGSDPATWWSAAEQATDPLVMAYEYSPRQRAVRMQLRRPEPLTNSDMH